MEILNIFIRPFIELLKYLVLPLPDNPIELELLANRLEIPVHDAYNDHFLDPALLKLRIQKTLTRFRIEASILLIDHCRFSYFQYFSGPIKTNSCPVPAALPADRVASTIVTLVHRLMAQSSFLHDSLRTRQTSTTSK